MRRISVLAALGVALTLGLGLTSAAHAADPVEGMWKSPTNEEGASLSLRIFQCGAEICGAIASITNGDQAGVGRQMVWGMEPRGGGAYRGGKVWAPDEDKTYNGRLDLAGNQLKVSGCVLGICRGEVFTRQ